MSVTIVLVVTRATEGLLLTHHQIQNRKTSLHHVVFENLVSHSAIANAGVFTTGSMHNKRQSFCVWKRCLSITEKPWLILLKCSLSRGSSFGAANTSKQSGDAKWFSEGMGACSEAQGQERLLLDMQTQSDQVEGWRSFFTK